MRGAAKTVSMATHFIQNTKILLTVSCLNTLANSLSTIFINIFLFKISEQFEIVVLFNLVMYLAWIPSFIVAGVISKQTSRRNGLIIGSIFQFIFYVLIFVLGNQAGNHAILLGLLFGVGSGFYWLAINVMSVDYTTSYNRDWFNGVNGMVNSLSQMIGPFLAGWFIVSFEQFTGYYMIFGLSFVIFFFTIILSLQLPRERREQTFNWRDMINIHHNREWRSLSYAFTANAFRAGAITFVIPVWVYLITKNEATLGNFTLISTGLTFLMYYAVGKYSNKNKRKLYMFVGNILLSIALLALVYEVNWTTLVIYGVISGICLPLFELPFHTIALNNISDYDQDGKLRIELVIAREVALSIGRITSIFLLYLIYTINGGSMLYIRGFIILIILIGLLPHLFLRSVSRKVLT